VEAGRGLPIVSVCSLSLLSHPSIDLFQSPTPILYPFSEYSYHLSIKMNALISEKMIPEISAKVNFEKTGSTRFQTLDTPLFTDVGFMTSLILIASPSIYYLLRTLRFTSPQKPLENRYGSRLERVTDVENAEGCQNTSTAPKPRFSKDY